MEIKFLDPNKSYTDKCAWYRTEKAELIEEQGKKPYIRFSLRKVMKSGRMAPGFSHYFNIGIPEMVDAYKKLGVTKEGISAENLRTARERYKDVDDAEAQPFDFYGFWHTQEYDGVYRDSSNNERTSGLYFMWCDEDDGSIFSEFAMTADRLKKILEGYTRVNTVTDDTSDADAINDNDQGNGNGGTRQYTQEEIDAFLKAQGK